VTDELIDEAADESIVEATDEGTVEETEAGGLESFFFFFLLGFPTVTGAVEGAVEGTVEGVVEGGNDAETLVAGGVALIDISDGG